MDPRQQRTWARLGTAVRTLASARPITEVTVAELAQAAGISRDTFYRHAAGPADLLAAVLRHELEAAIGAVRREVSPEDRSGYVNAAERAMLEHIAEHRAIYRNAMTPRLADPVRAMLLSWLEEGLSELVAEFPGMVPAAEGLPQATQNRLAVAYAASGTVGAIESWLAGEEQAPGAGPRDAARAIIAVSPAWWLR
ncbi:TetR/AcrR family transcriptional regulator [Sediminivirga luteola]|uniref:TetR family transcriptional regulator n=1 Tax=Sediminivirga luteola TaxID=1774748 RepID=A0A8J2TYG8_9MICO|nr:TetR/AcrR family transcriptional regulator [Sediminivirga luteola]MCI2264776.1 TetR/AcrR family transcriptional regulator [Sediminivirga luteola]GGA16528.1 TetR family transcriptional regulator [Sediminivirga luteola]